MQAQRDPIQALHPAAISLQPLRSEHVTALFPLLDDWEVVHMLACVPWPLAERAMREHVAAQSSPGAEADSFVVLLGTEAIGVATIKRPGFGDPPRTMPRLGYWIGRRYWGRGCATWAVQALTERAFGTHQADRVGAGVFADNPASRRVLEKLGFTEVRRYETHCLSRGQPVETADMQLSRAEYARSEHKSALR